MPDLSFSKKIRLLIVDDSFFFRTVLKNGLDADPRIEVVGMAADAEEAFKKIRELNPDVVTMDVEMPKLNGIDFIKRLIPVHPVPVVVVSSLPLRVLDALEAGAVDFVRKPAGDTPSETKTFLDELRIKVKIASTARVRQKPAAQQQQQPAVVQPHSLASLAGKSLPSDLVIAIGASTGGTDAILEVVKDLPATTPGIVIVQHMPPVFTQMYASVWTGSARCGSRKQPPETGRCRTDHHRRRRIPSPAGRDAGAILSPVWLAPRSTDTVLRWMCCLTRWLKLPDARPSA